MSEKTILFSYAPDELKEYLKKWVTEAIEESGKASSKPFPLTKRLSRKEVCDHYGIGLSKLHYLMREGKLPFRKEGRKTLFKFEDCEAYFSGE